jgi:hypothetical protein
VSGDLKGTTGIAKPEPNSTSTRLTLPCLPHPQKKSRRGDMPTSRYKYCLPVCTVLYAMFSIQTKITKYPKSRKIIHY